MAISACAKPGVDSTRDSAAGAPAKQIDVENVGRLRPQLRPEVRIATKGDKVALVTPAGSLLQLNEVGARVALLLDGQHTVTDIAKAVVAEYDVTEDVALRDTAEFVRKMEQEGLLAPAP